MTMSTFVRHKTNLNLAEAQKKLMDFVAQRDHSEKELRKKLSSRCDSETLEKAICWAKAQNWIPSAEKLKTQVSAQLSRRGKGQNKINHKLKELGLDPVKIDFKTELEKARKLVQTKWVSEDFDGLSFLEAQKLKAKIARFLINRGYESSIAATILNELKQGVIYDDE